MPTSIPLHAPSYHIPPDRKDRAGRTPLFAALEQGDVERVRATLATGARPNVKNRNGFHALAVAVNRAVHDGDDRLVAMLIEHGALVTGEAGQQALIQAARYGLLPVMQRLVAAGADVSAEDAHGNNALTQAASGGQEDAMRWLLDHHAPVDGQTPGSWSALLAAAQRLDDPQEGPRDVARRMVAMLLDAGANPNRPGQRDTSRQPVTPVLLAIRADDLPLVGAMACSKQGLALAQRVGGVQVMGEVLMRSNQTGPDSRTMFEQILARGPRLNDGPVHGDDLALTCATFDQLAGPEKAHRLRALLDAGADPMCRYPLNGACFLERFLSRAFNGQAGTAALREPALLERLAACRTLDVHATLDDGETMLMHLASPAGVLNLADQAARWLLALDADVNAVSRDGWTVLSSLIGAVPQAVLKTDPASRLLDVLLAQPLDWTAGQRPVHDDLYPGGFVAHIAVSRLPIAGFQRLLDTGMPVDQVDAQGNTPLHRAARLGQREHAHALIAAGAGLDRCNDAGERPHQMVAMDQHPMLARELLALFERQELHALSAGEPTVFDGMTPTAGRRRL